jgi:hypothetical protein
MNTGSWPRSQTGQILELRSTADLSGQIPRRWVDNFRLAQSILDRRMALERHLFEAIIART